MGISVPADRRFRRARTLPLRRRRRSWRAPAAAVIAAALALYGGYRIASAAATAGIFTISRIDVSGIARVSRGEVLARLDGALGTSLLTANLDAWRRALLDSPWVAEATIRRILPGTLAVAVLEREPMAIGRIGGRLYLIDREGSIIDEYGPPYADLDLPIVDGLAAPDAGGALVDRARAALAARVLAALAQRPEIAALVSEIDVGGPRGAAIILEGDTALVRIGHERFVERIEAYLELRPTLRERIPSIDYVDVRFGERVYVRPQEGGSGS